MDPADFTKEIAELALACEEDEWSKKALQDGEFLITVLGGVGSCAGGDGPARGRLRRALETAYRYGWVDFDFDPYDPSDRIHAEETGRKPLRGETIYRLGRCRNFRVTPLGRAAIRQIDQLTEHEPRPLPPEDPDRPTFFICHAAEDKELVARPLAEMLRGRGWRVWYDEFELKVGDSLRRQIDRGLGSCQYGIVVLSPAFLCKKPWSERELDGLTAREISAGGPRVILPVWHRVERDDVAAYSPALADRVAATTDRGFPQLVESLEGSVVQETAQPAG